MKEQRLFAVASQCPTCHWAMVQVFAEGKINSSNLVCDNCLTKYRTDFPKNCGERDFPYQTIRAITSVEDVPARRR